MATENNNGCSGGRANGSGLTLERVLLGGLLAYEMFVGRFNNLPQCPNDFPRPFSPQHYQQHQSPNQYQAP